LFADRFPGTRRFGAPDAVAVGGKGAGVVSGITPKPGGPSVVGGGGALGMKKLGRPVAAYHATHPKSSLGVLAVGTTLLARELKSDSSGPTAHKPPMSRLACFNRCGIAIFTVFAVKQCYQAWSRSFIYVHTFAGTTRNMRRFISMRPRGMCGWVATLLCSKSLIVFQFDAQHIALTFQSLDAGGLAKFMHGFRCGT
jgi:hypothetical protein